MTDTVESYYSAGGPFIPPGLLRAAQQGLFGLALAVSGIFLANFIWMWIRGKRPSPVKLVLLITSISFCWSLRRPDLCLRGARLFQVECRDRRRETHTYRCGDRFRAPAFLLRRIHLESTGEIHSAISRHRRRYR